MAQDIGQPSSSQEVGWYKIPQHLECTGCPKIKLALVKHLELALHGFQMGHSINFGTPFSFITKILPETRFIRVTKVMRYFMMAQLKFLTDKTSGFVQ